MLSITQTALNAQILGKLVASIVIISTVTTLLSNGIHEYPQDTINILMLILGSATTLLFTSTPKIPNH